MSMNPYEVAKKLAAYEAYMETLEADNAALREALADLVEQVTVFVEGHSPSCTAQYNVDVAYGLNPVCICAVGRAQAALATPTPGEKLLAEVKQ